MGTLIGKSGSSPLILEENVPIISNLNPKSFIATIPVQDIFPRHLFPFLSLIEKNSLMSINRDFFQSRIIAFQEDISLIDMLISYLSLHSLSSLESCKKQLEILKENISKKNKISVIQNSIDLLKNELFDKIIVTSAFSLEKINKLFYSKPEVLRNVSVLVSINEEIAKEKITRNSLETWSFKYLGIGRIDKVKEMMNKILSFPQAYSSLFKISLKMIKMHYFEESLAIFGKLEKSQRSILLRELFSELVKVKEFNFVEELMNDLFNDRGFSSEDRLNVLSSAFEVFIEQDKLKEIDEMIAKKEDLKLKRDICIIICKSFVKIDKNEKRALEFIKRIPAELNSSKEEFFLGISYVLVKIDRKKAREIAEGLTGSGNRDQIYEWIVYDLLSSDNLKELEENLKEAMEIANKIEDQLIQYHFFQEKIRHFSDTENYMIAAKIINQMPSFLGKKEASKEAYRNVKRNFSKDIENFIACIEDLELRKKMQS